MHPIELGNIVLMLMGVALEAGGVTIIYRTIRGARGPEARSLKGVASNGLNILIAIAFMVAGVLFVINNLRGNPLHFKP